MALAKGKTIENVILDAGQTCFENRLNTEYLRIKARTTKRGTILAQLEKIKEYREWMERIERVSSREWILEEIETYYKELLTLDGKDF